jgi:hypothetical protein
MSLQVAWQMLGLSQLNDELCCPVSAAEVRAQQLGDRGQLSNDNAAKLLQPFQLDLGVAVTGRGPRQFVVEVRNSGVLPLQWELHSYDAPQVRCRLRGATCLAGGRAPRAAAACRVGLVRWRQHVAMTPSSHRLALTS